VGNVRAGSRTTESARKNCWNSCNWPSGEDADCGLFARDAEKTSAGRSGNHGPRILFWMNRLRAWTRCSGALKALLGRMTERGVTIFLTSHCWRLWSAVQPRSIIHQGGCGARDRWKSCARECATRRNKNAGADLPFDRRAKRRGTGASRGTDVADVAQIPGVLAQLRLIAGLRWLLA